jgi:hypothetical protein
VSETVPSSSAPPHRPPRRKWPFVVLFLLGLPLLLLVGFYLYLLNATEWSLQEALAETDRLDPAWRLEDVEADRAVVPNERNAGMVALAAKKLLPKSWPSWDNPGSGQNPGDAAEKLQELQDSFRELEPQRQINEEQIAALRAELKNAAAALAQARQLADLPEGRYPVTYSVDFIGTLIPHVQDAREIANLLAYDALLRAQDQDADGALASVRAVLNAGRSIGDEPFTISQLVRIACRTMAVEKLQRTLAQGEPSEAALLSVQQLLEKEEAEPLMRIIARGERAGEDRLMNALQTGKMKLSASDLVMAAGFSSNPDGEPRTMEYVLLRTPGFFKVQRAAMLRFLNRAVEIAELPPEQQQPQFAQLEASAKEQPLLVRLLVPALGKMAVACQRSRAQLRGAFVAVAAERYRLARGQWPDQVEALKEAGYLREVPTDLYDGQPLRLRRLEDGLVIYSIGPDGEDNGGHLDFKKPTAAGTDVGFRLWDPAKRRQPPAPPKPTPEPGEMPPGDPGR